MDSDLPMKRRQGRRYLVNGQVTLRTNSGEIPAALVNIGRYGMLAKASNTPTIGTNLAIRFTVSGYQAGLEAQGEVVGTSSDSLAIKFHAEPKAFDQLFSWLDRERFIWTGADVRDDPTVSHPPQENRSSQGDSAQEEESELEAIRTYLQQLG